MKKLRHVFACLMCISAIAFALDLKLAWIFTDYAVLQREVSLPIWGTTAPDVAVTAEINGVIAGSRSSRTGHFLIRLPKLAAGGPYTLTVTATDVNNNATATAVCRDVLIGDVWLAGGQSNMQYQLNSDWSKVSALPLELREHNVNIVQLREYLAGCTPEATIRGITVPCKTSFTQEDTVNAQWSIMDADNAGSLTAVGAWFGRDIQLATGVPVGIISCNWGGTRAESWMSRSALMSNPVTIPQIENKDRNFYNPANSDLTEEQEKRQYLEENHLADPGNKGLDWGWNTPDFDDSQWIDFTVPGSWTEQQIMGNGSIWARRTVELPENWVGQELEMNLGGIDKHDITYVNGVEIGRTGKDFEEDYWNVPRKYTVTAAVNNTRTMSIAIRAFSFMYDGSFNGMKEFFSLVNKSTGERLPLHGAWKAKPEVNFGNYRFNPTLRCSANNANTPGILFDSMLRTLIPYGIKGAIWYQGESNTANRQECLDYRSVIATMIRDWRYQWGQGDFPFIQVQLAAFTNPVPYSDTELWSYLRESQIKACEDLPNVHIASALDIGAAEDIHPQNKKEVGRRLSDAALHYVYGREDIVPFGPIYKEYAIEGNAIRITFKNAQGLYFKDGKAKGFYIAGADMKFIPADEVTIDGETILVRAAAIAIPVAVRYAWANNPDGNLYNAANLPASNFRTDK